MKSTE